MLPVSLVTKSVGLYLSRFNRDSAYSLYGSLKPHVKVSSVLPSDSKDSTDTAEFSSLELLRNEPIFEPPVQPYTTPYIVHIILFIQFFFN